MADGGATRGRVPPSDLDAEAAVLSAAILNRGAFDEAREIVRESDFYADANARIWAVVLELDAAGQPVDAVTIAKVLRERKQLQGVGGTPYLAQITDATPAVAHVAAHARIVADKARQRRLVELAQRLATEGYGDVGDVTTWAQDAAQQVADVAADGAAKDPAETFAELVPRRFEAIQHRAQHGRGIGGIDTGWGDFTQLIGGWTRGKTHVVGGRPGMGKTAFVLGAALNVARQGLGVVVCSAEMTKEELVDRALGVEGRVNTRHIASGRLSREEWDRLVMARQTLTKLPLSLRHASSATVGFIRSTVRAEQRRLGRQLGLVVVDYLQLLDGERERGETREAEVARVCKRLTWMAAEFDAPLLLVSQLNRGLESRNNKSKRPTMADLRESGAIEQDAYTITLLYRDEYYNKGSQAAGTVEAIVAKNRNGDPGKAWLKFTAEYTRIDSLSPEQDLPFVQEEYEA